ncbi:MAG TPA: M1 family metallopeptidase [Balneolaceae bacterium]|nr:M1 family metallopeptidase [Balneolaceae bacterium]
MTRFYFFILTILFFSVNNTDARQLIYESGGELTPDLASFDVTHYDLNVKINPADSTVAGYVDIYFNMVQPNNQIALALDPGMDLDSVEWLDSSSEVSFNRVEDHRTFYVHFPSTLQPGSNHQLRVSYGGKPRVAPNPPWDGGFVWDQTPSGEPWIGVATQTIGAWIWWPNKDHVSDKADSVAINITMPENLVVASNGILREESVPEEGWRTWHWFHSNPISNYNITVNAAPYITLSDRYTSVAGDEMDIIFWVLPEFEEEGKWLFPQFAEQIRFLEDKFGPYPFRADKYGVAHAPFLGMEHQSLIAYGASFENDNMFGMNAGFDDLHQHELAHEWWGNLVTVRDWKDFWLHEGFGTYMQALYAEHVSGKKAYHEMMEFLRRRVSENATMEVAPRRSMSSLEITQGSRGGDVYYKGAWFLHTLRFLVGEEHFFEVMRRFAYPDPEMEQVTDGSQVRFVSTDDFLHTAQAVTGMDLEWFFEIYLRQPKLPELRATRHGLQVTLQWMVPEGYNFPMPVEVKIGNENHILIPENHRISFEVDESVEVVADPDHWILKKFSLNEES